ncbi:hypothetical protein CBL_08970 [Carabus blaptoides fortunei]
MKSPVKVVVKDNINHHNINNNNNDSDGYEDVSDDDDVDLTPLADRCVTCAYYINACFTMPTTPGTSHEANPRTLSPHRLIDVLQHLPLSGRWWIKTTPAGLLLSFSREEDANKLFRTVDLAQVMSTAVQVAKLPLTLPQNFQPEPNLMPTRFLIIRDVPWSIPLMDIHKTLQDQEMPVHSIDRYRQHIRIQMRDPLVSECLLREGFDFYRVARFAVSCLYNDNPQPANENDVTQCYRCQGFFHIAPHCRQVPRCVRCGDSHYANTCPRPRRAAVCCNCAGAHHAAHKHCPIRQHMSGAISVHFTLSVKRPVPSTAPILPDPRSDKPRCLL